jgi:hypothetical protein
VVVGNRPGIIYESPRRFEVQAWGTGHCGLVLRSNPEGGQRSRIEVWFKPAYAVCLPSVLLGMQIASGAANELTIRTVLGKPIEPWEELFTVRSGESTGWVLAGGLHGREDYRDSEATSMFDGEDPKPGECSLFSIIRDS